MRYVRISCRILLGLVFIFASFVKAVDPVGAYIKFSEYLEAFHWDWLEPFAMILANILTMAEFVIGVALVIGLRMIVAAWSALLFMSFFLVLTLILAIFNPVEDCGCFGDAIKLTNWGTFYKNLVLMGLAIVVFLSRKKYVPYGKPWAEWSLTGFFLAVGIGISVYCYNHLPIVDFRPYHVGSHIPSKMIIPEGAPTQVNKTTLIYEKNGVQKEFTIENLPDSTWTWKETKNVVISKGYEPPIHDFSITSEAGEDITSMVLADTSYSFLFIVQNASKVKPEIWRTITAYYNFANEQNKKFYVLTSSTQNELDEAKHTHQLPFGFNLTDGTTLKTIIRSNPGLMLLKDGVVLGLWHYNDFPAPAYFKGNSLSKVLTGYNKSIENKRVWMLGLGFLIVVLLLVLVRRK